MPARIAVALRPAVAGALPPPQTGPAVSFGLLAAVRDAGFPDLAADLHDMRPPKPYAVTPLLDETHRPPGRHSRQARFDVGVLTDELVAPILAAVHARDRWTIATTDYVPDGDADGGAVRLTAVETYPELLAAARPRTSWSFRLLTPTTVVTGLREGVRRSRPLPEPDWLFGSLANRWQAGAGEDAPLPAELIPAIEDHLEVVDANIRIAAHLVQGGQPPLRGSVGTVTYGLARPGAVPPAVRRALDALARFAGYAGLGDRTNVGMGVCAPGTPAAARGRSSRPTPGQGQGQDRESL
jgi:CRISPR-associated endoribonuclease Cas6